MYLTFISGQADSWKIYFPRSYFGLSMNKSSSASYTLTQAKLELKQYFEDLKTLLNNWDIKRKTYTKLPEIHKRLSKNCNITEYICFIITGLYLKEFTVQLSNVHIKKYA